MRYPKPVERVKASPEDLRREYDDAVAAGSVEQPGPFTTVSGRPIERLYDATDTRDIDYERDINLPGSYPYTRGIHRTGLSRQAVDHPDVQRLRQRRRDEPALPGAARGGQQRPFNRLRHAHADGLRPRRPVVAGRVRQRRRRRRFARRYGILFRGLAARQADDVDDDQWPRAGAAARCSSL